MSKQNKISQAEMALLSEKEKKFDDSATQDDCISDIRKIQEKFPLKHITRNFYRINGKYSDSTWSRFFGTFHEFRRQAGLELTRNQHLLEKHVAKHASSDHYKEFFKKEVLPYHQKYNRKATDKTGRFKTILVGSDFHDVDCDSFALSVFLDAAKRVQPDVIVLNGDVFDLYQFSSFAIDPRKADLKKSFDYVKKNIFSELRRLCPNSQIDFIIANHEYRLLKVMADKTPHMKVLLSDVMGLSVADVFGVKDYGINIIAKVDLSAFTNSEIMSEVRQNFEVYYDCFVAHHYKDLDFGLSGTNGHTHRPEQVIFRNYPMGIMTWTNTGCMSRTDAEYITGMPKWQQSFLLATVDRSTKKVIHNHVLIHEEFAIFEGVIYKRNNKD
jgi:hypothetical protein